MAPLQGSDYLNRDMLADESDLPEYTPQPLNAHRRRFSKRLDGVLAQSRQDIGREDRAEDKPLPSLPDRPSVPSPAPVSPPAPQSVSYRPVNLPARNNRMVLAVDFGTTYSGKRRHPHRMSSTREADCGGRNRLHYDGYSSCQTVKHRSRLGLDIKNEQS